MLAKAPHSAISKPLKRFSYKTCVMLGFYFMLDSTYRPSVTQSWCSNWTIVQVVSQRNKGGIVRDRGSNMKTRPWSLKKLEEVLYFTCLTLLSGICINCCIVCCILVFIFSYVHHASSYRSKKIVSKVRNFFQCIKLFFLSITR